MKLRLGVRLSLTITIIAIAATAIGDLPVYAETENEENWWDDAWPYRVPVTASATGPVGVNLDFSALFSQLGLAGTLLDLRSIRVVPYVDGIPGEPIPYQETYSVMLMDGEALNQDPASPDPYWLASEMIDLTVDTERRSQGNGAIKADADLDVYLPYEPDFTYFFSDSGLSDWSPFESLVYDVWPAVNESALDQTPDLYHLEILGLEHCALDKVSGPAMAMDQWNQVSLRLAPFGECTAPDTADLSGLRFFLKTYSPGNFELGDQVTLWLDRMRLVDQDGEGEIHWMADAAVDQYYLYFDSLDHAGHPEPEMTTITQPPDTLLTAGEPEAGGYFHQISGVIADSLTVWTAPTVEKVFRTQATPVIQKALSIQAARGEFEAFQLVINAETDQDLAVSVSDLHQGKTVIPSGQVELFRVDTVPLTMPSDFYGRVTDWPDPLYPLSSGQVVHFPANVNQTVWIRVQVPTGAPAGTYSGTLSVGPALIPFSLEVWDFNLPEISYLDFSAGFDWDTVLAAYGGTINGVRQPCADQLEADLWIALANYYLAPISASSLPEDMVIYRLTDYEVQKAHADQAENGSLVWWEFTGRDDPPLSNPAVIDRPGLEARILPTLAWRDRVDGLYYIQTVDWDNDPWAEPFSNDLSNGDGVLFYPPKDNTLGFDPCNSESNRLVPSIRLELLREGIEDYIYLWLLNGGAPEIGIENQGDLQLTNTIFSRTAFTRSPNALIQTRRNIADLLQSKHSDSYFPLLFR